MIPYQVVRGTVQKEIVFIILQAINLNDLESDIRIQAVAGPLPEFWIEIFQRFPGYEFTGESYIRVEILQCNSIRVQPCIVVIVRCGTGYPCVSGCEIAQFAYDRNPVCRLEFDGVGNSLLSFTA